MIDNIFFQLSILLGITVTIAAVMRLLRQPLMSAYIVAGIIAGPLFLNLVAGDQKAYNAFAEFGVVLLLFVVGLSLNISHIKKIGRVAVVTGLVQFVLTGAIGFLLLRYLNFPVLSALYLGVAIIFSSTIIIVKLLNEKKDAESAYGRHTLGLMIVQDIIAIILMLFITSASGAGMPSGSAIDLLVRGFILVAIVFFLSRYLLPRLLDHVAKSSEFLFIFTIAWCFGVASLLYWAGFSIEIGAVIAGLSLGSSPYQTQIASRVRPLRDFFIILFFIILGSEMSLAGINKILMPGLILAAFILFIKPLILYHLFRMQKFSRRNSFLAGVTGAQVSEFGFILIFTGGLAGHLGGLELPTFTIVALITIFISSYLITYNEELYRFLIPFFNIFGKDKHLQKEDVGKKYEVIIFGYHRIGWKLCEALAEKKITFAVVDFNPDAIQKLKHRGIPCYFGDAADVEFLSSLPLSEAKLVVSTLPEPDDQLVMIKHIKSLNSKTNIIANLYHNTYLKELYDAGADYVMMPHLLGGNWVASVLKDSPWTKKTFELLRREQKEEMKLRFTAGTHH
ncbi:MAG: cation:proton antiporter [Patescibacteria group bacterium]